jgi:hypothetical protein
MSETPAIIASGFPGKREDAHRAGITIAAFMEWANGISAGDRQFMRRWSLALLAVFIFTFAYNRLDLMYAHKFFDVTGDAQWIWARHPLSRGIPIAFFVTRDFDLPHERYFTKIKVAADPEYTIYFNGSLIAARRGEDGRFLDVYDVTKLARDGHNRIVIAVRSENGAGGVIAALDTRPDFHFLATGSDWKVVRRWSDDLPLRDPIQTSQPILLGRPPAQRWNFLTARDAAMSEPSAKIVRPLTATKIQAALPDISVIGGVAVAGSHPTPAVAYDFGSDISGRIQLNVQALNGGSRVVKIRRAYWPRELAPAEGNVESFVFAPGERSITDTAVHNFRYVLVYGGEASVQVVQ